MRIRRLLPLFSALLPIYAACSSHEPPADANLGATGMKLSTDIDGNSDVTSFQFTFTRVSCAGEAFTPWQDQKTESLSDAHISGSTEVPGNVLDPNATHLFADHFETLAAGCYDVQAQPLANGGVPSLDCGSALAKHVQVTDGQTAEVTLYSQCNGGDATGFIDVLGILNHRPSVNDLTISPSKFVNLCAGTTPTQTLCATARDVDHDPISFVWQQVSGPAVQSGPIVKSTSIPDAQGHVTQCVDVVLSTVGKVTFDVTVYDMVKDPAGPGYITFDQFYAQNGYPYTSHWTGNFPLYGISDPGQCGSGSSSASSSSGSGDGSSSSSSGSGGGSSSSSSGSGDGSSSSSSGAGGGSSSSSSSGAGPQCNDGIQNQGETGVDCGGPCAACPVLPTCNDGIQNQGETGVDCGGPCAACPVLPTCNDGIQNQGETGVDCGGPCAACPVLPTCNDGIQNQGETGVDCGGPCGACPPVCPPAGIQQPVYQCPGNYWGETTIQQTDGNCGYTFVPYSTCSAACFPPAGQFVAVTPVTQFATVTFTNYFGVTDCSGVGSPGSTYTNTYGLVQKSLGPCSFDGIDRVVISGCDFPSGGGQCCNNGYGDSFKATWY